MANRIVPPPGRASLPASASRWGSRSAYQRSKRPSLQTRRMLLKASAEFCSTRCGMVNHLGRFRRTSILCRGLDAVEAEEAGPLATAASRACRSSRATGRPRENRSGRLVRHIL